MVTVTSVTSPSQSAGAGQPLDRSGAGDPNWLNKYATPVPTGPVVMPAPSPALAEQMRLGAQAFAEFNETLSRLMDYGLIATWAERNARREEELGLPLSGWTGKEATTPAVAAEPPLQATTQPVAAGGAQTSSVETVSTGSANLESVVPGQASPSASQLAAPSAATQPPSTAGSAVDGPLLAPNTTNVASAEAVQPTNANGDQAPALSVSPTVSHQAEGDGPVTPEAPIAQALPTKEGAAPASSPSIPGPLPSLSSLTAASSHSSSTWIAPSTWYVSDELYAVRQSATEHYRQMNLGTLQKTLFDEA